MDLAVTLAREGLDGDAGSRQVLADHLEDRGDEMSMRIATALRSPLDEVQVVGLFAILDPEESFLKYLPFGPSNMQFGSFKEQLLDDILEQTWCSGERFTVSEADTMTDQWRRMSTYDLVEYFANLTQTDKYSLPTTWASDTLQHASDNSAFAQWGGIPDEEEEEEEEDDDND